LRIVNRALPVFWRFFSLSCRLYAKGRFLFEGKFSIQYFQMLLQSPLQYEAIRNSFAIGILTTLIATIITMPIAHIMTRFDFYGKSIAGGLLLIPMIMPPFVGAIGLNSCLQNMAHLIYS